jgi:hypothetical protein
MMNRLLEFTRLLRRRKVEREVRFVSWEEGDKLLRDGWRLAKEEDRNLQIGMVYVEREIKRGEQ